MTREATPPTAITQLGHSGPPLTHQDWSNYQRYKMGKKPPAAGTLPGPKVVRRGSFGSRPQVFRGEHGLPYVTDGVQVPTDRSFDFSQPSEEAATSQMPPSDEQSHVLSQELLNCIGGEDRPTVAPEVEIRFPPHRAEEHYQLVARHAKRELTVVKKKLQTELQASQQETLRLRAQVAALKENCDQQAKHIQDQGRALEEIRRESQQDIAQAYRLNYQAERRAATMQARLGVAAADQERAFAAAAQQLEALRRERDTLSEALAAIAEAAVGGQDATPEDIAHEAAIAAELGEEPLPRRPDAWLRFNYATPMVSPKPGQASKMAGDGERAVAALVSAVARLQKRTAQAVDNEQDALDQVDQLRDVIGRVDEQYELVSRSVENVERELGRLHYEWNILGMDPPPDQKGLPGRLHVIRQNIIAVGKGIERLDADKKKKETQILEMDFYKFLHPGAAAAAPMPSLEADAPPAPPPEVPLPEPEPEEEGLPDLDSMTAEEQASIIKIQAAARGRAARKEALEKKRAAQAAAAAAAAAEAVLDDVEAEELPDLASMTADEQASIIKIQAAARGRAARKEMAEKKAALEAAAKAAMEAEVKMGQVLADGEELPDLESISAAEQASIIKIQAAARGRAARKEAAEKKAAAEAAAAEAAAALEMLEMGELPPDLPDEPEDDLPDLASMSAEEQAKIVKIQAAARGRFARKAVAEKKQRAEEAAAAAAAAEAVAAEIQAEVEDLPDLDSMSTEEQAKIIKIQAAARGRAARKELAEKRAALEEAAAAAKLAESKLVVEEAGEALPDLASMTAEEQASIIKIQAAARGRAARKEMLEKRRVAQEAAAAATAAELAAATGDETEPAKVDELPDLDSMTSEEQAQIIKIQAAARGRAARKQVAAKRAEAGGPEADVPAPAE